MRIVVLALTPLARDARVVRSAEALAGAGHDVIVVARQPLPDQASYRVRPLAVMSSEARQRAELVLTQAPATLAPRLAPALYWWGAQRRKMLRIASEERPDIVYCNDWLTLPVGVALKQELGTKVVYDSHEFATREHVQNWKWRLISQSAVAQIERCFIASADRVITVSDGIADALQSIYQLPEKPTVVRNLPPFQAVTPPDRDQQRRILFHGLIRPERGLEELIDSIPAWTFAGQLTIRGYGADAYLAALRDRAVQAGVADRLEFAPPTSPQDLIAQAASADIGYLALPSTTEHYEFALPNKLFEYLMAGLAVLATPRTEIRRILQDEGVGVLADLTAGELAAALNQTTDERLIDMKCNALAAARRLNWEEEQNRLLAAVGTLTSAMVVT